MNLERRKEDWLTLPEFLELCFTWLKLTLPELLLKLEGFIRKLSIPL